MQRLAGYPIQCGPVRILSSRGLRQALGRYQIPTYSWMAAWLGDIRVRTRVLELWEKVFDGVPTKLRGFGTYDLETELVGQVHRERFPVDLEFMDDVFNGGDNPLDMGIAIEGYGVPWEVVDFGDLELAVIPVLCGLWLSGILEDPELAFGYASGHCDMNVEVLEWWAHWPGGAPTWSLPQNAAGVAQFKAALAQLAPPLNALSDLVDMIRKESGNVFIDAVSTFWQIEFDLDLYAFWCWCPDCVNSLADHFAPVRPAIERVDQLYEWAKVTPMAHRRITEAVCAAMDPGYNQSKEVTA